MGIRIEIDDIIDYLLQDKRATGDMYLLGTLDCRFSYKKYMMRHPEHKRTVEYRDGLMDTKDYFSIKGFKDVKTIDINERADIKVDFNLPIPDQLVSTADWLLDCGTLEHIFNVSTAISNIHRMLKASGIVLHFTPISGWDHGYYNFNPSFFSSFYLANGYEPIVETYHITLYNPLYTTFIPFLPRYFARFNLPFKNSRRHVFMRIFKSFTFRFGMPPYIYYVCAYKKSNQEAGVKLPYDVWE